MLGAGIGALNLSAARGSLACSLSLFLIWHGHQGCSYGLFLPHFLFSNVECGRCEVGDAVGKI